MGRCVQLCAKLPTTLEERAMIQKLDTGSEKHDAVPMQPFERHGLGRSEGEAKKEGPGQAGGAGEPQTTPLGPEKQGGIGGP
jgi:hypothetical protein